MIQLPATRIRPGFPVSHPATLSGKPSSPDFWQTIQPGFPWTGTATPSGKLFYREDFTYLYDNLHQE
jgi:hypothetical protein